MKNFSNILYISRGLAHEESSLKQAMSLLSEGNHHLQVAIIYPTLPNNLQEYRDTYEKALTNNVQDMINKVAKQLNISQQLLNNSLSIESEGTEISTVRIVQRVLRDEYNLVIKNAEMNSDHKGFKSVDLSLLRQCPCPVWLCHPLKDESKVKHIAVAVDPEGLDKASGDLAIHLLKLANSMAKSYGAKLSIISCWDSIFDERMVDIEYLGLPEKQAKDIIQEQEKLHLSLLNNLIHTAAVTENHNVQHLRGTASDLIPEYINTNSVDLLIMGTVGRTGITGFIIGNTAENIMHKLSCSLLALKPQGFVSQIKAY